MLKAVLDDLARDTALPVAAEVISTPVPVAAPQTVPAAPVAEAAAPAESPVAGPGLSAELAELRAALAQRDEQIAELQQAVVELAEQQPANLTVPEGPSDSELLEALGEAARRIATLESRQLEQEQTLRHTLTMLIEWIESDDPHRVAA
jgi:uncharacterized coiled-coil protein SlyX